MRTNKYNARKVEVGGEKFDSVKEYNRWCELKLLERARKISGLRRQVRYELIPSQYRNQQLVERSCVYVADFVYWRDGVEVVEDAKGKLTPEYVIKRKLMLYRLGIKVVEV